MSDNSWRRLLYVAAALSILAMIIIMVLIIPRVTAQPGMQHGADYILAGIQIFIAAILFATGVRNKREGCLTRLLLLFTGVFAILLGLLGLVAVAQEPEITIFWKIIRGYALLDIIIGIIAIVGCV